MRLTFFQPGRLGGSITIPCSYKIGPGTPHDKIFRIKGLGAPSLRGNGTGDQLIRVKVEIPAKLTPKQKELLEEFARAGGESLDTDSVGIVDKMKNLFE